MISLVLGITERLRPPRALHCEFPFGRPLGPPSDAAFQRQVLDAAFGLLDRSEGPVLEVFPEQIKDSGEVPLSCTVPPAPGSGRPQAVEEALAYRAAYERRLARTGRTLVGRCISAEKIPDVIERFFAIAEGQGRQGVSLPGTMTDAAMDVRAYYEEAAIELAGHVPAARSADAWFFTQTLTGRLLLAVQKKLRDDGEPSDVWFGIAAAAYVAARSG